MSLLFSNRNFPLHIGSEVFSSGGKSIVNKTVLVMCALVSMTILLSWTNWMQCTIESRAREKRRRWIVGRKQRFESKTIELARTNVTGFEQKSLKWYSRVSWLATNKQPKPYMLLYRKKNQTHNCRLFIRCLLTNKYVTRHAQLLNCERKNCVKHILH